MVAKRGPSGGLRQSGNDLNAAHGYSPTTHGTDGRCQRSLSSAQPEESTDFVE